MSKRPILNQGEGVENKIQATKKLKRRDEKQEMKIGAVVRGKLSEGVFLAC